jgi:signal transduction histidine kinase
MVRQLVSTRNLGSRLSSRVRLEDAHWYDDRDFATESLAKVVPGVTAVVSVGYRLVATIAGLLPWVWVPWAEGIDFALLLILIFGSAFWNFSILCILWAKLGKGESVSLVLLSVDAAASIATFIGTKQLMEPPTAVFLGIVVPAGTVALWASCRGWRTGLLACVATVPIALIAGWVAPPAIRPEIFALATLGHCLVAVGVVLSFRFAFDHGVHIFGTAAYNAAERIERTRSRRMVHDTALQTLEAISLTSCLGTEANSAQLLKRVGEMAASEARELRMNLDGIEGLGEGDVVKALEVAAEFGRRHHLDVQLATANVSLPHLGADAVSALVGAVNEALRNVHKHAGNPRVVIGAAPIVGGVEVWVRDFGKGADPATLLESFGWRESIRGRVALVGGSARLEARPGDGVTVRISVPSTSRNTDSSGRQVNRQASSVPTLARQAAPAKQQTSARAALAHGWRQRQVFARMAPAQTSGLLSKLAAARRE